MSQPRDPKRLSPDMEQGDHAGLGCTEGFKAHVVIQRQRALTFEQSRTFWPLSAGGADCQLNVQAKRHNGTRDEPTTGLITWEQRILGCRPPAAFGRGAFHDQPRIGRNPSAIRSRVTSADVSAGIEAKGENRHKAGQTKAYVYVDTV